MTSALVRPVPHASSGAIFWLVVHRRDSLMPDAGAFDTRPYLELRADRLDDPGAAVLAATASGLGPTVYCLRSRAEGGRFDGSAEEREARLIAAAARFDLVDLELARDLQAEVLAAVPVARRVVSWSGAAVGLDELSRLHRSMLQTPAALYRLVPRVRCASEALEVLRFLHRIARTDTIAYADGSAGFWTRLLAPRFGAAVVVADVDAGGDGTADARGELDDVAAGDVSWTRLQRDYGLPALPLLREVNGILGATALRSLSPRLHNAGYRTLHRGALFVPFVQQEFEPFWRVFGEGRGLDEIGLRLNGLTVGAPHKGAAAVAAASCAPIVTRSNSSNLLMHRDDRWFGSSTDPMSVLPLICQDGRRVRGARVAVIGCGGSGRSIAAALDAAGARVTLVNRHRGRGHDAAARLGLPFVPLDDFTARGFSVVVNATPIGRRGDRGGVASRRDLPFEPGDLDPAAAVVDLVCADETTALVAAARAAQLVTVDGHDVLAAQVSRQFRAMTGAELPRDVLKTTTGMGRGDLAAALA
jgi:3-dehydroquinate dehydratase / shikimate dehydrogenase